MIQDIKPDIFKNEFHTKKLTSDSFILYYKDNKILLNNHSEQPLFVKCGDIERDYPQIYDNCDYLFSISENDFFLINEDALNIECNGRYSFYNLNIFRSIKPKWMAFAIITGSHLYRFYKNNKYCGYCGNKMLKKNNERALTCTFCNSIEYPKISPAVIVGIVNDNKILMSKYAQGDYKKYALIAGFMEIGETLEQTVQREVLEEVGLKVKNIQYYGNQPWALSDSLLIGFFAELDGSPEITLDHNELESAEWVERHNIPNENSEISLTHEMIEAFRNNKIVF